MFVWTWVLVLSGLSHLGLPTLVIRLVPEYLSAAEHGTLRGFLFGGRVVALLVGTATACAGLVTIWLLGERLDSHYVLPVCLALACVPLCALAMSRTASAAAAGGSRWVSLPPYILRPLLLLGCMAAAHLRGFRPMP